MWVMTGGDARSIEDLQAKKVWGEKGVKRGEGRIIKFCGQSRSVENEVGRDQRDRLAFLTIFV